LEVLPVASCDQEFSLSVPAWEAAGLLAGLALLAMPAAAQQHVLNVAVGGAFTSMDPHFFNLGPNNVLSCAASLCVHAS
jgi:hypothetical protein